ncbi:MAG: response regulator [Cyclobacteriaceae bacterium]|nr:response regulator [Cyclobacteriaceae bacterium]
MKNILIIDDSMFQRKMLTDALIEMGYEVSQAENGAKGIEIFKELKPDCVVTDLLMPDMSGQEVIKKIKEITPNQKMLVISADIQLSIKNECIALGIAGFLNKPFNKVELKNILENLLG